jgi:hypothetical protein
MGLRCALPGDECTLECASWYRRSKRFSTLRCAYGLEAGMQGLVNCPAACSVYTKWKISGWAAGSGGSGEASASARPGESEDEVALPAQRFVKGASTGVRVSVGGVWVGVRGSLIELPIPIWERVRTRLHYLHRGLYGGCQRV